VTVLTADKLADGDHQLVDAFVGLAKAFIGFRELLGYPVETFSGFCCQFGDQFLERQLILRDNLNDTFQAIDALP
jgi:hypothetical protein